MRGHLAPTKRSADNMGIRWPTSMKHDILAGATNIRHFAGVVDGAAANFGGEC